MQDLKFLKLALRLSRKGIGFTEPNPMVGAVVVKDGAILSTGYHRKFGDIHAERMALSGVDLAGTTLYVTLEPCCHFGKTPPCTDIIIEKKVKRVVIASVDPNPIVSGKGIRILKNNGIDVELINGFPEQMHRELNRHYFTYTQKKRPYIALRAGVSIDGKLTDKNRNASWMTSKRLRTLSHELRGEFSAVLSGYNTVKADNPFLNLRSIHWKEKKLKRIVLDMENRLPCDMNIFLDQDRFPTYVFSSSEAERRPKTKKHFFIEQKGGLFDLNTLLNILYKEGIASIYIESGGKLLSSFFKQRLFDELILFREKKLVGGKNAIELFSDGVLLDDSIHISDANIIELETGYILRGYHECLPA